MEPIGWGLFFLGAGIAFAGYCVGSGIQECGDYIRSAMDEISIRNEVYVKIDRDEDEGEQ